MKVDFGVEFDAVMRDKLTGFKGVVTGVSMYHNGCKKIYLEPAHLDENGKILDGQWFDEQRVAPIPTATSGGGLFNTLRLFVALCDPGLNLSATPETKADGEIRDEIIDMTIAAGRTAEALEKAFADGLVGQEEVGDILETVDGLQGVLDRIRNECLKGPAVVKTSAGVHITRIPNGMFNV